MRGRFVNIVLALALVALPIAANVGWSEAQQVTDQTLPAPSQVERTLTPDVDFKSSPVMFIENVSQWDDRARFQVWGGPAGTMWLAEDAIWITVLGPEETSRQVDWKPSPRDKGFDPRWPSEDPEVLTPRRGVNIKISFVGANPHPRIETFDRLDTTVSYFYGNDPEQWRPDVPVWGGVRYVDLYPGIDLELTNEDGRIMQRLVAQPDADLSMVQLRVEGTDDVVVDGDYLCLTTAAGEFILPLLRVAGTNGEATVQPRGMRLFDVFTPFAALPTAPHSPVDNPADLLYSTFLGGGGDDFGYDIAVDGAGSAHIAGGTVSGSFPTAPGAFIANFNTGNEVLVAKLNPTGSALVYITWLGGSDWDGGEGIALDGAGSAFVTGRTNSTDFPTTAGAFDTSHNGGYCGPSPCPEAFVVKLNPGGAVTYATYLGGNSYDFGYAISVDAAGSAYVAGATHSSNFPVTPGAFDPIYGGGPWDDAFVAKLNPAGSALTYATFLGGSGSEIGWGITVDGGGSAYVTGITSSPGFPNTPNAFDASYNGGGGDVFVARLNAGGSGLGYTIVLGGGEIDVGRGIAVDGAGNIFVTGWTRSSDFPVTPDAFDTSYNGGAGDAFVARLSAGGSTPSYATYVGGSDGDGGSAIALDGTGGAYVAGWTGSGDFPATPGSFDPSHNGGSDAFVAQLNQAGSALAYATFLGGSIDDTGIGIALDGTGKAYATGRTNSVDFPTTSGAYNPTHNGAFDAFVSKLALESQATATATPTTTPTASPTPTSTPTPTATVTPGNQSPQVFLPIMLRNGS